LIKNLLENDKSKINNYCEQMGSKFPLIFVDNESNKIRIRSSYHICNTLFSNLDFNESLKIIIEITDFIQTILTISSLNVFLIEGKYPKVVVQISYLYTFLKKSVLILYENSFYETLKNGCSFQNQKLFDILQLMNIMNH
jgi:hypothetical protein